jgi:hypothetical protein
MSTTLETVGLTPEWRDRLNRTIASIKQDLSDQDTQFYTNYLDEEPQDQCAQRRFNWFQKDTPCPIPATFTRTVSTTSIPWNYMSVDDLIEALQTSKPTEPFDNSSATYVDDDEMLVQYTVEEPESEDAFQQRLAQWHLNRFFLKEWERIDSSRKRDEALARAKRLEAEAYELRKKFT